MLDLSQLSEQQRAFLTAPPSALSPEAQVNGRLLHGHGPPKFELVEELPWHRQAAHMFGCGGAVTIKEVAEAFEVDRGTVSNLLRQPWFQERVTEIMARHGNKDIMEMFRAEQFNSLITLIEIRDDPNASKQVRSANAINILDRILGKPTQRVETSNANPISSDPVAEVERLENALGTGSSSYHPGEIPERNNHSGGR